ncbi:unnamed protein product [Gongylonema pulchrum]|uniref:Protein boule-like n=1 Tax=Gongylonema pulchrum TaxID=637853 RepID=A0A183DAG1_9BILA|nr:unnamed protein product [Gongylonema pulchrum]
MYRQPTAIESGFYQVPEAPQPVHLPPAAIPIVPPQGTVFFAPPWYYPSGMPQTVFIAQPPNMSFESNLMEGPSNDYCSLQEGPTPDTLAADSMCYTPAPLPVSLSPFQPVPVLNPYVRANPVFIVQQPFVAPPTTLNPCMPALAAPQPLCPKLNVLSPPSKQYQPWSTATVTAPTMLKSLPVEENNSATNNNIAFSQTTLTSGYVSATETGSEKTVQRFSGEPVTVGGSKTLGAAQKCA